MFPFLPPTMSRQVLTRDAQLRIKASAVDAEGKPSRGRGRGRGGRGSKGPKQGITKQTKKIAPSARPSSSSRGEPKGDISDDWDEEERAQWDASGDWNEEEWAQWDASAQWTEEEWAEWEKGTWPEEGSSKPRGKRSRDKTKAAVAPKPVVPAAAPTGRSRPKQMGRARPGNHASIHEIDENDTFDYPRTFARRAKPPIKGSDAEKVWMAIAKGFLEEIAPAIENGTRREAEAGFTQETMCCQNVRLSFQIDEPRNLGAGLGRLSTGCMPEFAGSIVELALGTLASTSSC